MLIQVKYTIKVLLYGLRICTRFLSSPNSTEIKDISVNGSAVSEIAPVLEKNGEKP